MTLPRDPDARLFYRSGFQRFDDALYLLEDNRTISAIYLAGYAVECLLKALILSAVPDPQRPGVLDSFRGAKAHDFDWLKRQYAERGGPSFPQSVARGFVRVNSWTTDLRYRPGSIKAGEAAAFLQAAREILDWADGRL